RSGDALALYREGRRQLVEELGMEPGQELRELEQAILRQDTELELANRADSRTVSGTVTGTVTFLFTDIEGSTRLLKLLRSSYAEVLAQHGELLHEAIREHRGEEVDSQGDSFFACFRRAKDAVAAAAAIQRALAVHVWPEDGQVRVRIGIHTG